MLACDQAMPSGLHVAENSFLKGGIPFRWAGVQPCYSAPGAKLSGEGGKGWGGVGCDGEKWDWAELQVTFKLPEKLKKKEEAFPNFALGR